MNTPSHRPRTRLLRGLSIGLAVLAVVGLAGALAAVASDWRFLRGPAADFASRALGRPVTVGTLTMRLGRPIRVVLRDVSVGNVDWGRADPMARVDEVEAWISPGALLRGRVALPRIAVRGVRLDLERREDGADNWTFKPDEARPRDDRPARLPAVGKAILENAVVRIDDRATGLVATWRPRTAQSEDADKGYVLQHAFDGRYRDGRFSGTALTGLPFDLPGRPAGEAFPLRFMLTAGRTRVSIDGSVLDPAAQRFDLRLSITGPTLANLYPFLLLPLPASPPYELEGRLRRDGDRFEAEELVGHIGETDIGGKARYERREPRPLLVADLRSKTLNLADLGPLIGVEAAGTKAKAQAARKGGAGFSSRARADRSEQGATGRKRLLPEGTIGGERLSLIDAQATLAAGVVRGAGRLPLHDLTLGLTLKDSVLRIDPLKLILADGRLEAALSLDGTRKPMRTDARMRLTAARLETLLPSIRGKVAGSGRLGGTLTLTGHGESVAALLGGANGDIQLATQGGHLSNLLVEALGLDGAEVLKFLATGDRPTPLRCAVGLFDVRQGTARARTLVVDTGDTRIDGVGSIDFGRERLDLTFNPHPKDPSPLSLRSPLRLTGSFLHPKADVDRGRLAARAGASVLLGIVATPLAALLPLIETGPGEDAPCKALTAQAADADDARRGP